MDPFDVVRGAVQVKVDPPERGSKRIAQAGRAFVVKGVSLTEDEG